MRSLLGGLILVAVLLVGWIAYPFVMHPAAPNAGKAILVNKALNRLYYYDDGNLTKIYPVATGREPELTPEGTFSIITKMADDNGLGKDGIFGTRWLGLKVPEHEDGKYGIHGTNEPRSIGEHASAGCVRMGKNDVEELYEKIPLGAEVRIIGGSPIHRFLVEHIAGL